jgi:hypothetical protein
MLYLKLSSKKCIRGETKVEYAYTVILKIQHMKLMKQWTPSKTFSSLYSYKIKPEHFQLNNQEKILQKHDGHNLK